MTLFKKNIFFPFIVTIFVFSTGIAQAKLPELTELIADNSSAVVKVSSLKANPSRSDYDMQLEQLPPFFRDFFERQRPQNNRRRNPEKEQLKPNGLGSGFIVSSDGYILTNNHVIDDADKVIIRLSDRSEYEAEVIGTDAHSDIALLKIDETDLPSVKFANSNKLEVGSWVVAIGSPFGMDYSASAGIVSAIGRSLPSDSGSNYVPFIQTDVAINPGNSGGPLFNMNGEVVGINSQIYTRSGGFMGLSFAIPSNVATNVYEQLKDNGIVQRGYLGVSIRDVDKDLAEAFGLKNPAGALINQVFEGTPADKAGIENGDIILKVNGKPIEFSHDLPHIIGLITPGEKVKAELMREGKNKTITIEVGSINSDDKIANRSGSIITDKLGIDVDDISERDARRIRTRGGVKVLAVEPDSPAEYLGLAEGDIIVQLGFNKILNVEDMEDFIEDIPSGEKIPIRFFRRNNPYYYTISVR